MRWRWWRQPRVDKPAGSFVADVTWERSEELRTDRLGPGSDDLEDDVVTPVPHDPERPVRTLGPLDHY